MYGASTYYYQVIAMNRGSCVIPSATMGMFTTADLTPQPPIMFEGVSSTNSADPLSLTFNWLAPNVTNGDILDYTLTCVSVGITKPPSVISTTTSATLSNLEKRLQYCCTVTARNAHGNSKPSTAQCISTLKIADMTSCSYNNGVFISIAAVIVVLVLLFLSVTINVVLLVQRAKSRRYKFASTATQFSSEKAEIMTTQCEVYEMMKLKEEPDRVTVEQTKTDATGPEKIYEEVREGLLPRDRHGKKTEATPQMEPATQVYVEVSRYRMEQK